MRIFTNRQEKKAVKIEKFFQFQGDVLTGSFLDLGTFDLRDFCLTRLKNMNFSSHSSAIIRSVRSNMADATVTFRTKKRRRLGSRSYRRKLVGLKYRLCSYLTLNKTVTSETKQSLK
jgi:hypothetical protein